MNCSEQKKQMQSKCLQRFTLGGGMIEMSRLRGGLNDDFLGLKDLYSVNSKCTWSVHEGKNEYHTTSHKHFL